MTLDEYQLAAARTGVPKHDTIALAVSALGIAGEAGEVADLIKKTIGHGHALDHVRARKELGDVLWYVADIARALGMTLSEVAQANVDKLLARYPMGFSSEASIARKDIA